MGGVLTVVCFPSNATYPTQEPTAFYPCALAAASLASFASAATLRPLRSLRTCLRTVLVSSASRVRKVRKGLCVACVACVGRKPVLDCHRIKANVRLLRFVANLLQEIHNKSKVCRKCTASCSTSPQQIEVHVVEFGL